MNPKLTLEGFKNIRQLCQSQFADLEMWPSYYERRYHEFLSYYELLPKRNFDQILELGCSVGYYSAFLSIIGKEVTATDQESSSINIHQGNLTKARRLIDGLGIKNVEIQTAVAEQLPFNDNSFDLVISSHVMGYIKNQKKALSEIYRVLKPGGIHFCVVPAKPSTLIRLIEYYFYLFNRCIFHLVGKHLRKSIQSTSNDATCEKSRIKRRHIFFPTPQGAQENWFEELSATQTDEWKKLLNHNNRFKIIHHISTQFNPSLPLGSIYFPNLMAKLYGKTRSLELRLGKIQFLRYFGLNSVVIGEKA